MASRIDSLKDECELRLHFSLASTPCRLRCQQFDCSQEIPDAENDSGDFQYVDLCSEAGAFTQQGRDGVVIYDNSYVVFRTRLIGAQAMSMGVKVTMLQYDPNAAADDDHKVQGHARILPSMFSDRSDGIVTLPLQLSNNNIGQEVKAEYLLVKPNSVLKDWRGSTSWDHPETALDMGHRGMGKCRSKNQAPHIIENTVKSFNEAAKIGADYVEFDVQLTKDKVPLVFHDFVCRLPNSDDSSAAYRDIHVQDLTFDELRNMAGFALANEGVVPCDTPDECERLFPTLTEVFQRVDPSLGFNVEIKYPNLLRNGSLEDGMTWAMDINQYLDIILETIHANVESRRVILSCFNPDVCIALNLKQRRFPVLYLTQGEVERYDAFLDRRTRDVPIALKFAAAEGFLGVNPISEYILNDFSLVKRAHDLGLVMMCWGSENSDSVVIETLKKNGVHAVIYDRINEFIAKDKKVN